MDIGQRIAARIDALDPPVMRKEFAALIGMPPDALSRVLTGKRGLSSLELVTIAQALDADMHELVTGEADPNRVLVNARHTYDRATTARAVPTFADDQVILGDIVTSYAQAMLPARDHLIPGADPAVVRTLLGRDFVRPLADRIEERLHVDVLRVDRLGTAYSGVVAGRPFIVIPATGSWFRENWDLAHELAHVAGLKPEADANRFAADLLLPEALIRSLDWTTASADEVAAFLWESGVSTHALAVRLDTLRMPYSHRSAVHQVVSEKTQRALRQARGLSSSVGDEITARMDAASRRRFPLALQEAHEIGIEEGRIAPDYLAWMRGVDASVIAETYTAEAAEPSVGDLAEAFGLPLD